MLNWTAWPIGAPLRVKHHLLIEAVPDGSGLATAIQVKLPLTVEPAAGEDQDIVGLALLLTTLVVATVEVRPLESVTCAVNV